MQSFLHKTLQNIKEYKYSYILFIIIFCLEIFLRFYNYGNLNLFGWDQVEAAWAAKNILVNHSLLLLGPAAKGNSGLFLGPLYFYYVSFFYFFTHLDPLASGIIAGTTSIISSLGLFFILRKLFPLKVAFLALFINTVCMGAIIFDRIEWNAAFIPIISLAIFYALYKVLVGKTKYLIWLGVFLGISFHIHLTSIFYGIAVICCLPFFPKKKETLLYGLEGLAFMIVFLVPTIIVTIQNHKYSGTAVSYGNTYYHGLHLKRIEQLAPDAFIQYIPYLFSPFVSFLRYLLLPLFSIVYLWKNRTRNAVILTGLMWLWFVIPWIVFSTYGGELSDYYFASTRFIALITIAYLISQLISLRLKLVSFFVLIFLGVYGWYNISGFFALHNQGILYQEQSVRESIQKGEVTQFAEGVPTSYIYYMYTHGYGLK
ncbi:MAG TPA: glycosyltransferase family 39 protein [Candidatus Saccharimonadales bacterium]|nr:glycosyltransferase family 39 protein [Candidatus Saccharimonadales bacterium]